MILCNVLVPQLFWLQSLAAPRRGRCSIVALLVNVGMWFERFVIIVASLNRDFLPSSWGIFTRRRGSIC